MTTKWHNSPKGPSVCKASKGKCPFGGEEAHYAEQETAMTVYQEEQEREFGLIPKKKSHLPWSENNPHKWKSYSSYNPVGEEDGKTWVRPSGLDPNKAEFYSKISSTDGVFHIISKGVIDLNDKKKINEKEVEKFYGVKRKDDPVTYMNNVISYYGGDNFDDDPVYLNGRRVDDIEYEIDKVQMKYEIPFDEDNK